MNPFQSRQGVNALKNVAPYAGTLAAGTALGYAIKHYLDKKEKEHLNQYFTGPF